MKSNIEELLKKYMDNPPEGMTSKDIRNMSEDELLDMVKAKGFITIAGRVNRQYFYERLYGAGKGAQNAPVDA